MNALEWLVQDQNLVPRLDRQAVADALLRELEAVIPRSVIEQILVPFWASCDEFRFLHKTLWLWTMHALVDLGGATPHPMLDAVATVITRYQRSGITRFGIRLATRNPVYGCDILVEFVSPDSDLRLVHHFVWPGIFSCAKGRGPTQLTHAEWEKSAHRLGVAAGAPVIHAHGRPIFPSGLNPTTVGATHVNNVRVVLQAPTSFQKVHWFTVPRPGLARWMTTQTEFCGACARNPNPKHNNFRTRVCVCWSNRCCTACRMRWPMDNCDFTQAQAILGTAAQRSREFALPL